MSLTVKNLEVSVGSFSLRVPELTVGAGEITGVMGKSGSGKSTLLTALGGFAPHTGGEIWIEGENRAVAFPERRRLAYVFQKNSLFPHLSLERNVAFPLEVAGDPDWRPKVHAWLDRLGLGELADRRPDEVSGGEAQRAALARALVSGFKVMLFDEPFSALDPKLRRDLRGVVQELVVAEKLSVLWVTHDLDDIAVMKNALVLEKGQVAWQGLAAALPRERYF